MANPKPNATLYFTSGKSLDVIETVGQVTQVMHLDAVPMTSDFKVPPAVVIVTVPSGDKHWVQMRHVERVSPA